MAQYQVFQDVSVKIYDTDDFSSVQKKFNSVAERSGKEVSGFETMQAHIAAFEKLNNRLYWESVDTVAVEEAEKMCGYYLKGDNFGKPIESEETPLVNEVIETPKKEKRVSKPVSPLHVLLPQVFKKNGKVSKHPYNDKIKSKDAREVMRKSMYLATCDTVMVLIPVGTCTLDIDFKEACVNSKGESIFDFVLEEMMMQGWIVSGVKYDTDANGNRTNFVQVK